MTTITVSCDFSCYLNTHRGLLNLHYMAIHLSDLPSSEWAQPAASSIIYRGQRKYRLAHSTHFPELHNALMYPIGWLGRWAAPPDCLTWLQMVLKSRPGVQPEGPGPLGLHRNCAICSARRGISLLNLDTSYHHDDNLAAMFFIESYGSVTAGPRRGGAVLRRSVPTHAPWFIFFTSRC